MTSADNDCETGVLDDGASTTLQSAGDTEESCDQPDISMFPFVTVSPCRRKSAPATPRPPEVLHSDDGSLHYHADSVQSSSSSAAAVAVRSCSESMSPSPTVSSTWMSPARVTSCTFGSDTPSPESGCVVSPKDGGRTPQMASGSVAGSPRVDVPPSPDTASGVVLGARSPTTSTPAAGARVDVLKVPVYSPVYRDPAAPPRRHVGRPTSPRRCAVVAGHTDVLDLSSSRRKPPPHQQTRPGSNWRRPITFADGSRDRQKIVCPDRVPLQSPDEQATKSNVDPRGSLSRKLSVSMSGPPHRDGCESRLPVVVCERHEADSASLSPSKLLPPTSNPATTTVTAALFVAAAEATLQGDRSPSLSARSSRLVVNLQRCDSAPTAAVALPGRAIGAGKRRRAVGGRPSPGAEPAAAAAAPSKRRRLKLMCNGMTIYRDIDDVAASSSPAPRVRTGRCPPFAAVSRRRASLPTFSVASPRDSVVKRRHVSSDDDSSQSRDRQPFPVPVVDATSSQSDVSLSTSMTTTTAATSDGDSGIGPLDYSTDRSSIGTVPTDSGVPSSLPDSSLTFDEPLELTTEQVRQRQKNDCRPSQLAANQFAVC